MHLAHASEPSFASAPHGHARPRRHPGRADRVNTRSPVFHQCRSCLLSGIKGCAARQPRVPSAPGTIRSCRAARFLSTGSGRPGFLVCYFLRTLCFPRVLRREPESPRVAMRAGGGLSRLAVPHGPRGNSLRRADRLWPPSFRGPVFPGTGARRAESHHGTARAGALVRL